MAQKTKSIRRATTTSLAQHHARFTLDGLQFHVRKLHSYTNPTGGGLDKIPLNTKRWLSAYYAQFEKYDSVKPDIEPEAGDSPVPPPKQLYLRKKALYHVADHLLGIGKKAYWTGSTRASTLLGLDIDDHESGDAATVQANAEASLQLFVELTGWKPIPCSSPGGINAFLICHRNGLSTEATNRTWHGIVRAVDAERKHRGLAAILECKGQARVFHGGKTYCGVQFKDPLWASNPTDEELYRFWEALESGAVQRQELVSLLSRLANDAASLPQTKIPALKSLPPSPATAADDLLPNYRGSWAKKCRAWAIQGLPCHDSITQVVQELSLWLYFVELYEVDESDRFQQVVDLLTNFILKKHNGYVTRINIGQIEEVENHILRIVQSAIDRFGENGREVFSELRQRRSSGRYVDTWQLAMAMAADCDESSLTTSSLSSVRFTYCCSVSDWLPAPEFRRQQAKQWIYVPDERPLPSALEAIIRGYYAKHGIKLGKRMFVKILRFLNYLSTHSGEARLGIKSLKKMGFSNHPARQHLSHLEKLGVIETAAHCKAAGLSKQFRLRPAIKQMFEDAEHSATIFQ